MKTLAVSVAACLVAASGNAQDWARQRLTESPRHQEWVKVKHGNRTLEAFQVFPEIKDKATVVVVIHENMGLTDWVCSLADELAEAGYIAVAPDLLSGMGPKGGRTTSFADASAARETIYKLPADQVTADLSAVVEHAARIPAGNGVVVVAGFCWGGLQSFCFAANNKNIKAAFVFYGTPPEDEASLARIECPVYGFYGGNDERVTATVPAAKEMMKKAGKAYDPVVFDGAGHGFMRGGDEPKPREGDKKARDAAWQRWKELLKRVSPATP